MSIKEQVIHGLDTLTVMKTRSGPRIIFPEGFDERAAFETPLKGWLNAQIELEDGCRYAVYFSDPIRLQQDVDEAVKSAKPCFAEPGLIIVPEVTIKAIQMLCSSCGSKAFLPI